MSTRAAETAERAARESYGRLLAFLAARTGDVAGAEDALAEAFATALADWPRDGVPGNPEGWLLTVARRRQTDALRRARTRREGEARLDLVAREIADMAADDSGIPERRLALMFACAHPAIEPAMRTALILQCVLGLSAEAIAGAFLVTPATMGQRLVRAKARIRAAAIPFELPERVALAGRLDAMLAAVYAAYGRGWDGTADEGAPELAGEAIWLGTLLVSLMPGAPEALGMLSLMLFIEARRPARRGRDGRYVPLEAQDAALWDANTIARAEALLAEANRSGPSGRYQIEAAIQSAHMARRLDGIDTRAAILALYDHLVALTGSPVARLNRAVALAEIEGPLAGLDAMAGLAEDRRMRDYQPYWAARGALCARLGRREAAREALTLAMGLAREPAVRRYLEERIAALRDG